MTPHFQEVLDELSGPALLHVGVRRGDEQRGNALDRLALAGADELVAARFELALDRLGELGLGPRIAAGDLGERVDRHGGDASIRAARGRSGGASEEAEADVVAREQELDDRLAVGAAASRRGRSRRSPHDKDAFGDRLPGKGRRWRLPVAVPDRSSRRGEPGQRGGLKTRALSGTDAHCFH